MEQNARLYNFSPQLRRAFLLAPLSLALLVCVLHPICSAYAQPSAWGSKNRPTEQPGGFDTFGFSKPQQTPVPVATAAPTPDESETAPDRVLRVIRQTQAASGVKEETPESTGPKPQQTQMTKRDTTAQLPKDQRFWQWASWYREHGVLSLVVDGRNRAHLTEQLQKLAALREKKRVAIGQIVIIGGGANLSESVISAPRNANAQIINDPAALRRTLQVIPTEFGDLCEKLNVTSAPLINSARIIEHFNLSSSPAWIVRYQGRDYIFEGQTDINRLFTADGRFVR